MIQRKKSNTARKYIKSSTFDKSKSLYLKQMCNHGIRSQKKCFEYVSYIFDIYNHLCVHLLDDNQEAYLNKCYYITYKPTCNMNHLTSIFHTMLSNVR